MARDLEISLSEALLDPGVGSSEGTSFLPNLVEHEPYEIVREPMLLFRPPTIKKKTPADKKTRRKSSADQPEKQKKWDGKFFSNKKDKTEVDPNPSGGPLKRSRSFDTLHRRLTGWEDIARDPDMAAVEDSKKAKQPVTFVYNPPRRRKESRQEADGGPWNSKEKVPDQGNMDDESKNDVQAGIPKVPKRDSQLFDEGVSIYEVPVSISKIQATDDEKNKVSHEMNTPGQVSHSNKDNTETAHGSMEKTAQSKTNNVEPLTVKSSVQNVSEDNVKAPSNPGTPKLTKASSNKGSSSPQAPNKPARSKNRASQSKERKRSFTELDIMSPATPNNNQALAVGTGSEDVGLLKIRLMGVRTPQKQQVHNCNLDDSDEEAESQLPVVMEIAPTDGLFCTLSINGKQSRFESSLQPLKPRERTAVWDQNETEAVFYATGQQQVFVTSRKLPLKDHKSNTSVILSQNPKAECFGVGIHPLAKETPQKVSEKDGSISNWAEVAGTMHEATVELEPHGSVLLGISYIMLNPCSKVTCNGTVTIKFVNGLDTFKNEEPCWICCTVDIDNENFGTTASVLGLDDFLNKGFTNDPIDFVANDNTACRIQVWGFGNDEAEHWFGESYIPLAAILPYSKLLVHQEDEGKPLKLLEDCEREIIMPLEPMGTIGLVFNMSPAPEPDDPINEETIRMFAQYLQSEILEASGIFTPAAIAHFRQTVPSTVAEKDKTTPTSTSSGLNLTHSGISTIPEESSLGSNSDNAQQQSLTASHTRRFIPSRLSMKKKPEEVLVSGEFDHLAPSPTTLTPSNQILRSLTRSFKDKRQSLRLLGGIKLQVPLDYKEKAFRQLPDDFDPFREIEILKVEMKDVKAQLAETQFHREKAEVKVKALEREIEMWKEKYNGKKKGRKYH